MNRVAITGIGLATPLGIGTEETWHGLVEGRSAIGPIQSFDASSLHTQLGAEILDFEPKNFVANRRVLRMMTRGDRFSLVAATLAVKDAGIDMEAQDGERAGLFVGGNKEISDPTHVQEASLAARNPDGSVDILRFGESAQNTAYPLFFVEGLQAGSLFYISQAFGLKGANTYFAGTAEASSTAIGRAYRAIRRGEADVVLAGGFDDAVSWWSMSKYDSLGTLTERNDLGAAACRPFDRDRTGAVLGEGAAFLLLEDYDSAVRRGARIYAEIAGFGSGYDAYKLLEPHPEARGLQHAVHSALKEAGSAPSDIGYVATHGSGTKKGDASEARGLAAVFSNGNKPLASSIKAATGDLEAAAGSLNVGVAALALYHQTAPPTLNLDNPDPDCGIDLVPKEARDIRTDETLALARGLEGQGVAVVVRAVR